MIEVKNLFKSYGKNRVLEDLSFTVDEREHVCLSAPSGAGKTTLLRILCGLESADKGTVSGIDPRNVSYLFQESRLFPQLTALENVTCIHEDPQNVTEEAAALLETLGLAEDLNKRPAELSGGMKQRVALARTLLADRPVVFLDEPFTALDPERKDSVRAMVSVLCKDKTLLLVSHDPADAEFLTNRTISL